MDIDILIGEPGLLGRGIGPRGLILLLARLPREGVRFAGLGTSSSNRVALRAFGRAGFRLCHDFHDPEFGPSKYLVAQLCAASELAIVPDAAIESVPRSLAQVEILDYRFAFEDLIVTGRFAFEWGEYRGRLRVAPGEPPIDQTGKLMRILERRDDGSWAIARTIYN